MNKINSLLIMLMMSFTLCYVSCGSGGNTGTGGGSGGGGSDPMLENRFKLEVVFPNLVFDRPLDIQNAGDRSDRLFVVEQKGVIYVISPEGQSAVFLDIQDQVEFDESERGLLGLAFHPDFELNGYSMLITHRSTPTVV